MSRSPGWSELRWVPHSKLLIQHSLVVYFENLMSTDQEKISTRNVIEAHAQDLVVNDSCYYPSWKHSHSALANYTVLKILHFFSLSGSSQTVCRSLVVSPTASSPRTASDTLNARGNHLAVCNCPSDIQGISHHLWIQKFLYCVLWARDFSLSCTRHILKICASILNVRNRDRKFLRSGGVHPPNYTASHSWSR
jgi:hypothetical protein